MEELKTAAFEILLENPGSEQSDWANLLIEQYGSELSDEYGSPSEVYSSLEDLWESPYYDSRSGLEYDFHEWAEAFANETSVRMYYDLIEKIRK